MTDARSPLDKAREYVDSHVMQKEAGVYALIAIAESLEIIAAAYTPKDTP